MNTFRIRIRLTDLSREIGLDLSTSDIEGLAESGQYAPYFARLLMIALRDIDDLRAELSEIRANNCATVERLLCLLGQEQASYDS